MYKPPERFPLTGPLEITDYEDFVEKSKTEFFSLWNLKWTEDSALDKFTVKKKLGSGTFGIVFLLQHKVAGTFHAQKTIEKMKIVKTKQLEHTKNEINIMKCINFPFAIYLEHFFKDNSYVHLISPFISGGELFYHLRKSGSFEEHVAKFFVAQVIMCIEYLHNLDIVYRDLKLENILIDNTGYLKLADFGFSRILKSRTYTLCGTPEYLAPEIVLNRGYGKSVDWWAIGILLFEMVAGRSPFYHKKSMLMYERAAAGKFSMPKYFSEDLQDLVANLLQPDLSRRYGNLQNGADDVKKHKWFRNIEWIALLNRKLNSPFVPKEISTANAEYHPKINLRISSKDEYTREFENF